MKNFSENLKKLRRQKDMTQEQLAEYLNISSQSVSKWETNLTLPDITLLPILANIFNVSSDTLLGIDITVRDMRIKEINTEAVNCELQGHLNESEKILRAGLKEYPNSYSLMTSLAGNLRRIAAFEKEEHKAAMKAEVISLCEKVLAECIEDEIRYNAIRFLCYTYCDIGETDKARDLIDKLPDRSVTKNYLTRFVLKGKEKNAHIQKEIAENMHQIFLDIMTLRYVFDDNRGVYIEATNLDDSIALDNKVIDIINILCEDGKFGYYNSHLADAHQQLSFNLQKKDIDAAVRHLRLSAKHAILFDAIPRAVNDVTEEEYTSLLFRGMKVGFMKYISQNNKSKDLLNAIERGEFNSLPADEINAVTEELRKYAS